MTFLNSILKDSKEHEDPFRHWELNKPLSNEDDIYSQENSFESFSQEEEYSFIKIGGRVSHMKFQVFLIILYHQLFSSCP